MEQQKFQYLTPEEVRNIDPSLIDYVTMNTGTIVKVENKPMANEFMEEIYSNPQICQYCGRYRMPTGLSQNDGTVLRAPKKTDAKGTATIVQQEAEVVGKAEEADKEALKAKGLLLNNILTGDGTYWEEQQYQGEGQGLVQQEQKYYDNQYAGEQQYVQEENQEQNEAGYQKGYYEQQYEGEQQLPDNNLEQNLQYQEEGYPNNQGVSEQNVEQNIQNENYAQEYTPKTDNQVENAQEYEQQQIPQGYTQNEQVPQEQYQPYAPTNQTNIPIPEPVIQPTQQPIEQKPIQPPTQQQIQPPNQQQVQLPTQQQVQPPIQQPGQPPIHQQGQPPIQQPGKPFPQPQIKPGIPQQGHKQPMIQGQKQPMIPGQKQPMIPSQKPLMIPGMNQNIMFRPGQIIYPVPRKGMPKVVPPPPLGPQKHLPIQPPKGKFMPPGQQKKLIPAIPPQVVMPKGQQKKNIPFQPPKVVMPSGVPKVIPASNRGPQKTKIVGPKPGKKGFRSLPPQAQNEVLRARKAICDGDICPDCLKKTQVLCPDCQKEEDSKTFQKYEASKTFQKEEDSKIFQKYEASKTFQNPSVQKKENKDKRKEKENLREKVEKKENKYSSKTYQKKKSVMDADFDNYKYHEINVTTSNNIKSKFIVKKAGVIISEN